MQTNYSSLSNIFSNAQFRHTVQTAFQADEHKDAELFSSIFADNGLLQFNDDAPYRGKDAIQQGAHSIYDKVDNIHTTVHESWEKPGSLAWRATVTWTTHGGDTVDMTYMNALHFNDAGKVTEYYIHATMASVTAFPCDQATPLGQEKVLSFQQANAVPL